MNKHSTYRLNNDQFRIYFFFLLVLKIPYKDFDYFSMQHSIQNNEAQCFSFLNANLSEIDKLNMKLFCRMNLNIYY